MIKRLTLDEQADHNALRNHRNEFPMDAMVDEGLRNRLFAHVGVGVSLT